MLGSSLFLRPETPTLLAPVLGPWAGRALGHTECTLASSAPGTSVALAIVGVALVAFAALRPGSGRIVLPVLAAAWSIAWNGMALLSVANTCI